MTPVSPGAGLGTRSLALAAMRHGAAFADPGAEPHITDARGGDPTLEAGTSCQPNLRNFAALRRQRPNRRHVGARRRCAAACGLVPRGQMAGDGSYHGCAAICLMVRCREPAGTVQSPHPARSSRWCSLPRRSTPTSCVSRLCPCRALCNGPFAPPGLPARPVGGTGATVRFPRTKRT